MLKKLKNAGKSVLRFLAKWSELVTIPIALVLWYFSGTFLRWLDPTSATYDAGIFQIILFTIIQFFIFSGVVWIYMKIAFPRVYRYLDDVLGPNLESKNNELTQWEKSKVVLWVFSLLLVVITFLARVI